MNGNYTPLTLTVNGDPNIAVAYAKQGDKNASGVVVTMVDESGNKITIPTGLTAKMRVLKPDRRWVEGNATIQSDGTVKATYTDQMLVIAGPCLADITLSENDQRLSSMNFTLMVERAPMGVDEDSYNEFGSLAAALEAATAAAESASTSATAAAASATSTATAKTSAEAAATRAETAARAAEDVIAEAVEEAIPEAVEQMTAAIEPDDFRRFWKDYFDSQRTGKVYGVKFPNGATAATTGIKLLDNEGLVCEPSDLTTEGQDDYADIPLFKWWHVNYEREEDGTPYPTAVEGSTNYQTTGAVDVGAMQMSFWWKVEEDSEGWSYLYITDMPKDDFEPWWECVRADGTVVPWVIGSAYFSGEASDGKLRSQPGLAPAIKQSYNNMHTNYQMKGAGYHGAGSEANLFQIIFILIKYATQNSQSLFRGCTDYSFQYDAATTRTTEDTWFPVPTSNAVVVGTAVSVGYPTAANSKDRGNTDMHTIANMVKVLSVEDAETYKKVYLDCEPFTVEEDSNGHLPCLSSMEWRAGSTDDVIGHHDGAMDLSDWKHPYRIQGREYAVGGYVVGGREVIDRQNNVATLYSRPKGVAWSNTIATVRSTYDAAALLISNDGDTNPDVWIQKIKMDPDTGVWAPIEGPGASSAQHWCDRYYAGGVFTGQREYLQGGRLGDGSDAGFCILYCGFGLGGAGWGYVARD